MSDTCCEGSCATEDSCVVTKIDETVQAYKLEAEKFYYKGNKAAGTRARKLLSDLAKLAKEGRADIQDRKGSPE